jgi:cytochrome P450
MATMKSKGNAVNMGDFLSLMLNDELFAGKDEYIIDECLTFMLAATMTTTMLINNSIYYLTQNEDKLAKLREDIGSHIKIGFNDVSADAWKKIILDDELLSTCNYLSYVVNEVLRIDPSLRFSTIHEMAGACQIGPYNIMDGQRFIIYIHGLQNNPA